MLVRLYRNGEEQELWRLFFKTIHEVNCRDYSVNQINAWAPADLSEEVWCNKIQSISPFVVEHSGKIIGYSDLQDSGYIDHFFCHSDYQGLGVGRLLMSYILKKAHEKGISELSSDVSVTAKPFYEKMGFSVVKEQFVEVRGCKLKNYHMGKVVNDI